MTGSVVHAAPSEAETKPGGRPSLPADVRAALPGWVTARVLVVLALVGAHLLFDALHLRNSLRMDEGLMAWDGQWYRRITEHGYEAIDRQGLRFFPAYPLLARALRPIAAGSVELSLLFLSNVPALVFGALLHRLCLEEQKGPDVARRAAWLAALAPSAFVLVLAYGEALAACMGVAMFLALRSRRWWWAVPCGVVAGLLRPSGALLAVPALVEAVAAGRQSPRRQRTARAAAVLAPLTGMGVYLAWVGSRFGDPFLPVKVQSSGHLRGGFDDPLSATFRAGADLVRGNLNPNGHHFPWIILVVVLVLQVFRRWPLSYGLFAAVTVVAALSAERLGSFERYAFSAFPVVLALASLAEGRGRQRWVIALSGAVMAAYATVTFLNGYVP